MDRDSSSDKNKNATCSAGINTSGFICTICFKVFHTGHALGGHQNAHLLQRSLNQNKPNILGAVLNHLPPDEFQSLAAALARSNNSNKDPPHVVQHPDGINDQQGESMAPVGGHTTEPRVNSGASRRYRYYKRQASEDSRRQRLTKNLLGEWKAISVVREEAGMQRFSETSVSSNSIVRVSSVDSTIDLELRLMSRSEDLDLELKLGF